METASLIDALRVFCDYGSVRYPLSEPWSADRRIYATDGRVAAWVDSDIDVPGGEGRKPNMASVVDLHSPVSDPFPELPACSRCNRTGQLESVVCDCCDGDRECSECRGSGTEECHACGHEHDCEECDGSGECSECGGTGQVSPHSIKCDCLKQDVHVFGRKISGAVARKIASLPGVLCGVSIAHPDHLVFESECGIRGITVFGRD